MKVCESKLKSVEIDVEVQGSSFEKDPFFQENNLRNVFSNVNKKILTSAYEGAGLQVTHNPATSVVSN